MMAETKKFAVWLDLGLEYNDNNWLFGGNNWLFGLSAVQAVTNILPLTL